MRHVDYVEEDLLEEFGDKAIKDLHVKVLLKVYEALYQINDRLSDIYNKL